MNTTELKGNWLQQKGKLKQKFAVLTDSDLLYEQGKKEEMLEKIGSNWVNQRRSCEKLLTGYKYPSP